MNSFIYDIPTKVYFGKNQLCHLREELVNSGKKFLMTYGGGSIKRTGHYEAIVDEIRKAGLTFYELSGIEPNPKIDSVRQGVRICKKNDDEGFDVRKLIPASTNTLEDAGPCITLGMCYASNPETVESDITIHRLCLQSKDEISIFISRVFGTLDILKN